MVIKNLQKKQKLSSRNVLNGLLIGATVGAGFATFESAGYAFYNFLMSFVSSFFENLIYSGLDEAAAMGAAFNAGFTPMMVVIVLRGILAIGGHVAWAACEGAALALSEGDEGFELRQLADRRFLVIALISVVLHGIWDMDMPVIDSITIPVVGVPVRYLLLIVAIWLVVAVMLHRGLAQINLLANKARRHALRQMGHV